MTAHEIINHAMSLNTGASMLELSKARNNLNRIADVITSDELVIAWGFASEHINDTIADQKALAIAGHQVRIM